MGRTDFDTQDRRQADLVPWPYRKAKQFVELDLIVEHFVDSLMFEMQLETSNRKGL